MTDHGAAAAHPPADSKKERVPMKFRPLISQKKHILKSHPFLQERPFKPPLISVFVLHP
ncbi:hypothetical protein [Pseudoramibacter alactolyticus]|uniref:hypothetical protein n=1 Tax=Pseudoramibacter alactolyticus TaxID=113287 RepID=UPI002355A566|nr:hypothetical protein [Pseudoramibacter alactolyticus]